MASKIIVIISTAEKEKAMTGILYATNILRHHWLNEAKVVFFGPFEKLLADDKAVQEGVKPLIDLQKPLACKFISDTQGVSAGLAQLGVQIDYVGQIISDAIKEGYVPMVF